jgi:transcriptional regulator with XRE-family HTH domain
MPPQLRPEREGRNVNLIIRQLIEERRRQGISQREVTRRIGKSTATLNSWERGLREPTLGNLQAWADALDLDVQLVTRPS